jgi:hypothetical protein
VYSSCYVSKRTFKDKHFKSMLRAVARSNAAPILTQYMLKEYVRAEFSVFLLFLALIIKLKMGQSHDAPFAQAQHDGGTAANKKKYQALAMQFIDPKWLRNLVICIGFKYSPQNKDADVAALFDATCLERCGYALIALAGCMVSDSAASGVSRAAEIEVEETCDMHDGDKVGQSATGRLLRTRKKHPVNPFVVGVALMAAAHAMGVHFSYGNRFTVLCAFATTLACASIKIKVDLNGTRIAAQWGLLFSCLRMNRALKMYQLQNPGSFAMTDEQWIVLAEFEAVLSITQVLTKMAQYEELYTAAYGPIIKLLTYKKLTAQTISVIAAEQVTASPKPPRVDRPVDDLTPAGKECLERAVIEFQRRFMGNTGDTREVDGELEINDRQLAAILLDVRTCGAAGSFLGPAQVKAAYKALKTIYVDFAVVYGKSDREKKAAESARAHKAAVEVKAEPPHKKARNEDPGDVSSGVVFASGGDICADVSDSDAFSDDDDDKEDDDGEFAWSPRLSSKRQTGCQPRASSKASSRTGRSTARRSWISRRVFLTPTSPSSWTW